MDINVEPFERYTERYERWFEEHEIAYRSELKAVEKMLPAEGVGIEVGVGGGRFSKPFSVGYGLDPSINMLKTAGKRGIEVVRGLGEKVPFKDTTFDFVLIVTTICFFDEPLTALEESDRILKNHGKVIIGFIDKESPVGKEYREKREKDLFYREAEFYSVDEVSAMLERAGFSGLEYVQTLFKDLNSVDRVEETKEGHEEGSFVVVRGEKG